MIQYKCDRCGKILSVQPTTAFRITIDPPEIWNYSSGLAKYTYGEMHLCPDCMNKVQECIEELGRSE